MIFSRSKPVQHKLRSTRRANSEQVSRQKASRRRWLLLRRRLVMTLAIIVITQLGIGGWVIYRTGEFGAIGKSVSDYLYGLTADAGFALTHMHIDGVEALSEEEIAHASGLYSGQPMLAISLTKVKGELETMPDIRRVRIERILPDRLHVTVEERKAHALWQHQGEYRYIDRDGTILRHAGAAAGDSLPVLVGEDVPEHAESFLAMIAETPSLRHQVKAAVRVGERRWDVHLQGDELIRLPGDNPWQAWMMLAHLHQQKQLLHKAVSVIDMRLPDRLFITLIPGADTMEKKETGDHEAI